MLAADRPTQPVRTEVYRLERLDSVLLVDLAVDLTGVHLAPDCTVYLFPLLASENTGDSLSLPPIVLQRPPKRSDVSPASGFGYNFGIGEDYSLHRAA